MMSGLQSRKIVLPASVILSLCAALAGKDAISDPPAESEIAGSISIGLPMDGALSRGQVLPKKGAGYLMMAKSLERKARFGVMELVMLVKEAAHRVQRRYEGSVLAVADLSTRKGGSIDHHGSHQNGRDVDFAFYMTQGAAAVVPEDFVPFDANGHSVEPPMRYRFDTARNWALVEALLDSRRAEVQWIFVADHLKDLMLEHALASGASKQTIGKARQLMRQPGKKGHWDHFHVRIYCPKGDVPRCRDVGPRWAWLR